MVIYEVNLTIDAEIYTEFFSWLEEHMHQMLQFPGFIQASLFKPEEEDFVDLDQKKLTVQYQLENRADLQRYFTEFAANMREKGIERFGERFGATRRIFEVKNIILK